MSTIEDDRSYTVCDLSGCDKRKPRASTRGGKGAAEWYRVEWRDGYRDADYCTREHAAEALASLITPPPDDTTVAATHKEHA